MTRSEGEPNYFGNEEYITFFGNYDEDDYVDPWRVKAGQMWRTLMRNKLKTVAAGTAFAATLGGFAFLGRYAHQNNPEESFGSGSGPGVAGPGTSVSINPNKTPTQSSGGFINGGNVSVRCIDVKVEAIPGTSEYYVTPAVEINSGDKNSPYIYTVVGQDNGTNVAATGVTTLRVDRRHNSEFPHTFIIDTFGTRLGEQPNNPESLRRPLGDYPDGLINECPYRDYPDNFGE